MSISPILKNSYTYSIIIPVFNEEDRIKNSIDKIKEKLSNISYEIIIINDGSTDSTQEILKTLTLENNNVVTLTLEKNIGKGYAVTQGFLIANGSYVLMTDADLSTPIETLLELDQHLIETYDILIGSRMMQSQKKVSHGPISRKFLRKMSYILRKILFNLDVQDTQCGFKIFKHEVAQVIAQKVTIPRYGADLEKIIIAQRLGYKIKEFPVEWIFDSKHSKIHLFRDSYKTFIEWITIKWNILAGKY